MAVKIKSFTGATTAVIEGNEICGFEVGDTLIVKKVIEYPCGFKSTDEDPCKNCPRKITNLDRCGLLQDVFVDNK